MKFLFLYLGIASLIVSCKESVVKRQSPPAQIAMSRDAQIANPFVSISLDKQNTAYIGFDNPVTINTNGLDARYLEIATSPGAKFRGNKKNGILSVTKQGGHTITVRYKGQVVEEFTVRAKYIPDPPVYLGNATSGTIEAEVFKAQRGIYAPIMNMDIGAKCSIVSYQLLRVSSSNDRLRSINEGGGFDESTMPIIQQASPGDIYQFTQVVAKCPGDEISRKLNPLAFEIR